MNQKFQLPQRVATFAFWAGLVIAVSIGAGLRLPDLDLRPMHVDEAIQAARFGQLLEEGTFDYLPDDGHGPGHLYFAIPVSRLAGTTSYETSSEWSLRLTPALFGIGLVALTAVAFRRWLGSSASIASALLVAASPMMGFYSRYFIMELPMVFFLLAFLACSWRYLLTQRLPWLLGAGLCGAIMHATKETFGISIVALVIAIPLVACLQSIRSGEGRDWFRRRVDDPAKLAIHLAIALPLSLLASAALYSVWFSNPEAIADSYKTYSNYFNRATGPTGHEKPWHYYLQLLFYKEMADGFNWSEALTLVLAAIGILSAFTWRSLPRETQILAQTLALYTIFSFAIYSLIPYKTPWSIMAALHGATLLAGFGFAALLRLVRALPLQAALWLALLLGIRQLATQSATASFPYLGKVPIYAMENRNPYVYGHTTTGFVNNIVEPMQRLLAASPDGKNTVIRIIHNESAWPIPWYFRDYPINPTAGIQAEENAPLVLTDDAHFDTVQEKLGDAYTFTSANLREEVWIYLFYKQSLFDLAHPDL
ncbi:MAG: flippase activity-associated protein Agl23 [Verrucomicrobiales bacterium]